jgi:adenylosuccinate lyase
MAANLHATNGLVFSQPVLLALIAGGLSRDDAYRIVQRNAMSATHDGVDFRSQLETDPEVTLDRATLDAAFDVERALPELDRVSAALDAIEVDDGR